MPRYRVTQTGQLCHVTGLHRRDSCATLQGYTDRTVVPRYRVTQTGQLCHVTGLHRPDSYATLQGYTDGTVASTMRMENLTFR